MRLFRRCEGLLTTAHRGPKFIGGTPMNDRSEHRDDGADQRRSAALIGLIIILALAIAGVVLVRELRERSRLEDCLMSGRTNCAPIEAPLRR